jgi:quercetin dioxygenase-like cupin family protein
MEQDAAPPADDPRARLRAEGLDAVSWSNGPGDRYGVHHHAYDKVIVVEQGSIRFALPERGDAIELEAGDRMELRAGTEHEAHVGPDGVTCLEAHRPAGTLADTRRLEAGAW